MQKNILLFTILFTCLAYSQNSGVSLGIQPEISIPVWEDVNLGGNLFITLPGKAKLSIFIGGAARPYSKDFLIKTGEAEYYQLKEYRTIWSIGIDKHFLPWEHFGFFAKAGVGYTYGRYKGSDRDVPNGFTPLLSGGILISHTEKFSDYSGHIRIGFGYSDLKNSTPFSLSISYSFIWSIS